MNIENLSFSQKQKDLDTQDLILKTFYMEFKNFHKCVHTNGKPIWSSGKR